MGCACGCVGVRMGLVLRGCTAVSLCMWRRVWAYLILSNQIVRCWQQSRGEQADEKCLGYFGAPTPRMHSTATNVTGSGRMIFLPLPSSLFPTGHCLTVRVLFAPEVLVLVAPARFGCALVLSFHFSYSSCSAHCSTPVLLLSALPCIMIVPHIFPRAHSSWQMSIHASTVQYTVGSSRIVPRFIRQWGRGRRPT